MLAEMSQVTEGFLWMITFMALLVGFCGLSVLMGEPLGKLQQQVRDTEARIAIRYSDHLRSLCQRLCALEAKIDRLTETLNASCGMEDDE